MSSGGLVACTIPCIVSLSSCEWETLPSSIATGASFDIVSAACWHSSQNKDKHTMRELDKTKCDKKKDSSEMALIFFELSF